MLAATIANAQYFSGTLAYPQGANQRVVLWVSEGSGHIRLDSVRTDQQGAFTFSRKLPGAGFYQVSVNDSDRADVILTPGEKLVRIEFSGRPLQENIHVMESEENKKLWEYKAVSREAQAVHVAVDAERRMLDPTNVARARQLDSVAYRADLLREEHLARLIAAAPSSYFAKAVGASRRLDQAAASGPEAVLSVFSFGDPELLRSSVYARAIITYLQAGKPGTEQEFFGAVDTLLLHTLRDSACFHYALGFLAELFIQYGPELAAAHVVDRWIAPGGESLALPQRIKTLVADQLKVSPGRIAPDMDFPTSHGPAKLSSLVGGSSFTTLMFYGSGCDHCQEQLPHVRDQLAIYRDKGYRIVGVALDVDSSEFKQGIAKAGITWPVFSEFKGFGGSLVNAFQVKATPYYYVLGPDLRIIAKPANYMELAMVLRQLYR